jgi:hypothetical protein
MNEYHSGSTMDGSIDWNSSSPRELSLAETNLISGGWDWDLAMLGAAIGGIVGGAPGALGGFVVGGLFP